MNQADTSRPSTTGSKQQDHRSDPDKGTAKRRDQERTAEHDQRKQEEALGNADQIDKGPSACNPSARR